MTTEDALQALLDANPDDHTTRLILADWLQDYGDPRAEGYRALGTQRLLPADDIAGNWVWFKRSHYADDGVGNLSDDWYGKLRGYQKRWNRRIPYKIWRSRRRAENTAALAFSKLSPERRAQLLSPEPVPA